MQIYLPIAEMSVNAPLVLGLGALVGMLSGLFGVGGGFLITPLLIFTGIPPAVAVATGANQLVASAFSGVLTHWRRRAVDVKMGLVLLAGGLLGSTFGVQLFAALRAAGQVELMVALSYVVFLGTVGAIMLVESLGALRRSGAAAPAPSRPRRGSTWLQALPLKMRFRESKLYASAIPPFVVGVGVGVLAALMGVGGGFIMVPAMIYLLGMPTSVVVGTSLFQILFLTAWTTMLHAVQNQTVDAMLAVLLIFSGAVGAQVGARLGIGLRGEQLRILLAVIVLAVCARMAVDLVATPAEPFSLAPAG
ncbi:MAG: sulfite exporter TauE/SafE family protein [Rhodobacteraceae bacterium]|nr:MAG: sulfite exporter TauE/SafE family protein [Paracoccaceae bacterium]